MSVWEFVTWFVWIYLIFACIGLFIRVFVQLFRDPELSGGAKLLWTLLLVILPLIGVVIYIAARGNREAKVKAAAHAAYLRESEELAKSQL